MTVSHNAQYMEMAADASRMITFFIVYGTLPYLLKSPQHHYAQTKERSRVAVLLKYAWQIVTMTLTCSFWKFCMNSNLPSTEEVPMINYPIYWLVTVLIGDLHFYAFHRLMHCNRFLYKHVHSHHHSMPSLDMEPLDYLEQHPVEMLLSVMPIAYVTYIAPIVPEWYAYAFIYFIHGMGLAAHR